MLRLALGVFQLGQEIMISRGSRPWRSIGRSVLVLTVLLVPLQGPSASADALDHWHWRNPLPNSVGFEGMAFGDSRFVGVGDGGWILSSNASQAWSTTYAGYSVDFGDVLWSERGFLAFGFSENRGILLRSSDGVQWSAHDYPKSLWLTDVAYANGLFVGVGLPQGPVGAAAIARSADGLKWTEIDLASLALQPLNATAHGSGRWVAVGDNGFILTSADGADWTVSESGTVLDLKDIAFGGGRFVAIGNRAGSNVALVSPDGLDWTVALLPAPDRTASRGFPDLKRIASGASGFVAIGEGSSALFSPDGTTWTEHPLGQNVIRGAVAYGNGQWVAGGLALTSANSFTTAVFTSTDGMHWEDRTGGVPSVLQSSIAFGNGVYVTVGTGGRIARSTSDMNWSLVRVLGPTAVLSRVVFAGDRFLALGRQNTNALLLVSQQGREWTNRAPSISANPLAAAYGNGRSVVVGDSIVLLSTNGIDWNQSPSTTATNLVDVIFDGRQFVAVGRNGTIQTSLEGVEWTTQAAPTDAGLRGIASDGSTYVAVGSRVILVSTNAVDWKVGLTGEFVLQSVAYGGGWFVAAGGPTATLPDGVLLTSPDGKEWNVRNIGGKLSPRCLAFDGRTFLLGGEGGAILQSDPLDDPVSTIVALRRVNEIELALGGGGGRRFRIESAENLGVGQTWSVVGVVSGESNWVRVSTSPVAGHPRRFFRARVEP